MKDIKYNRICQAHGYSIIDDNNVWLVLEYMEGGNLREFLESDHSPLSLSSQLDYCIQATMAVNFIHVHTPLLHRDIKSENFFMHDEGQLVLGDFGLAEDKEKTGNAYSTLHWSAPEVLGDETNWTIKADIYSLGMVFFEIVGRQIPFIEEDWSQLPQMIQAGTRPTIPADCDPVGHLLPQR